ncbi:MAG TPA: hypothetical protein ACFYEC_06810 [Candidatus Brocadiaceae bacterium]
MPTKALIAILASTALSGCLSMPGGFNGIGADPMSMLIVYRTDKQPVTREQYQEVVKIAQEASAKVGLQLSSSLEAAVSSGFPYGLAGAAGGGIDGAITAGATGTAAFLGGMINGLQTASYANVWLVGDITEITLRDRERDGEDFHHLHVSAAFIRTSNTVDQPARGLIK